MYFRKLERKRERGERGGRRGRRRKRVKTLHPKLKMQCINGKVCS